MALTEPALDLLPSPGLIIGNDRVSSPSGGVHQHIYAATGRPTAAVPLAGPDEMNQAVLAARAALTLWHRKTPAQRRDMMLKLSQLLVESAAELSALQTLESAIPQLFAAGFPAAAAEFLSYNAGWVDKQCGEVVSSGAAGSAFDYTVDEPYGVVAIIIPWNGPLVAAAQVLGPVLAAGNTVVLKPPELAPFTCLRLGDLARAAGFPAGVVNVVPSGPDGGHALVNHPGVDKIHFTGGPETARSIVAAAGSRLAPVSLELGGKSAHIIFAGADIRAAARQAISGAVLFSGQGCANGTRVLIEESVHDQVVDLMLSRLRTVRLGDPLQPGISVGPVITEAACDRIMGVIAAAIAERHGNLVAGGSRMNGDLSDGYFISPTVFTDVDADSQLAQREIFGPVLSVFRFSTEEEAVRLANQSDYGLAAYIHSADLRKVHRVSRALQAGSVFVNGFPGLSPAAPFGGVKQSGYGRLGGLPGVREFRRPKNIWISS